MGNVNFEPFPASADPTLDTREAARIRTIALEPEQALEQGFFSQLEERRIDHTPLRVVDHEVRQEGLETCEGGVLGILRAAEIVIGTTDWDTAASSWQTVLDPIQPIQPGFWRVGEGPSLRLVKAEEDAVQSLVLDVRSLSEAGAAARDLALPVEKFKEKLLIELTVADRFAVQLQETNHANDAVLPN